MCTSTRAVIAVCVCARERDARVAGHILMSEYRILGIGNTDCSKHHPHTLRTATLALYTGLRYRLFDFAIFTGTPATRGMLHNPTR